MGYKPQRVWAMRLRKANKPGWQDKLPRSKPELKDAYAIAAKREDKFAREFIKFQKKFLSPEVASDIKAEWSKGSSLKKILSMIPFFDKGDSDDIWLEFANEMMAAYGETVGDSGDQAMEEMNTDLKTNFKFEITKADRPSVPIVPVNPHSIKWMRQRALGLITDTVAPSQIEIMREILSDGFRRGLRAEVVMGEIESNLGLGAREYGAIVNRRKLLEAQGLEELQIDKVIEKYRKKLLVNRARTIARTETIAAQAHGRNTAWKVAQDSGKMPAVEREWSAAPESPNPNRPCEICQGSEGLDGMRAPVGGMYNSPIIGPIDMPPAHPNCRCTEKLVRKK